MIPGDGHNEIRRRLRNAIEQSGVHFNPDAHEVYLNRQLMKSSILASKIIKRLNACATPATRTEFSLLQGVPFMTAFAYTATDCLYHLMAHQTDNLDDVRHAFSLFVIGSAVFDYICDVDVTLFPTIINRISEDQLRLCLWGYTKPLFSNLEDPPLLRYAAILIEDKVYLCRKLMKETNHSNAVTLRQRFTDAVIELYRAEVDSSRADTILMKDNSVHSREDVWINSLLMLYSLIALTPDVSQKIEADKVKEKIRMIGRLFVLIDDIIDLEADWYNQSPNLLLQKIGFQSILSDDYTVSFPWEIVLGHKLCDSYMNEITSLLSCVLDPSYEEDLIGWLYSWLKS